MYKKAMAGRRGMTPEISMPPFLPRHKMREIKTGNPIQKALK
jgi:hypothetical protein